MTRIRTWMLSFVVLLVALFAISAVQAKTLNIQEDFIEQSADPGAIAEFSFTVENNCTEVLNISFATGTLVMGSASIQLPNIPNEENVLQGAVRDVFFNVTVPTNQRAGTYTGVINASDGDAFDSVEVRLIVNSIPNFEVSPTNIETTIPSGFSDDTRVTITNTGNSNLTNVELTASQLVSGSNTIAASAVSFSKNNFDVNYNSDTDVIVTIAIPSSAATGDYTGSIIISSGSATKTINITLHVVEPVGHLKVPSQVVFSDVVRAKSYSKVIEIENDGDFNLNNIEFSSTAADKYNVSFSSVPSSLAPGASDYVTVEVYIPETEDAGLHTIGEIEITTDKYNTTLPLKIEPKVMMRIKDLDIYVNGKDNDVDVDGGDSVDIEPGAKVEVVARVENLYRRSDNIDLENVVMYATINSIDDGDDLEEETDEVKIRADRYDDLSVTFDIPWKVDEDTYELDIRIEGEDELGAQHEIDISMDLELEKESHKLIIKTFDATKKLLKCERTTQLEVEIMNLGDRDEDEVVYRITNSELGIDITEGGPGNYIELVSDPFDTDNTYSRTHTMTIPGDTEPGTYTLIMKLYRDRDELEDTATVELTVVSCTTTTVEQPTEQPPITVITPTTVPFEPQPVVAQPGEFAGISSTEWIIIGLLGAIFLIALIIIITVALR